MSRISVVVSVYNEEAVIAAFWDEWRRQAASFAWDWELVFVDDGSSDASPVLLDGLAAEDPRVRVVHFSRNFGHEAAMIAGIDCATGDGIVCMDVDLQHPISCLPEIMARLDEGYDVITMVRLANESAGLLKGISSWGYYKVLNLLSDHVEFREGASDFFALSARAADVLRRNYREKRRFLRGYVQDIGFRQTSIEYRAADRAGGASHYSLGRLFHFAMTTIVSFSDVPLKVGIYAGVLSGLAGLVVLIYTLFTRQGAPSGYATIVVLLCFMFAMLFFVVGIIGQYLASLYSELKDRPIYIVERRVGFGGQAGVTSSVLADEAPGIERGAGTEVRS